MLKDVLARVVGRGREDRLRKLRKNKFLVKHQPNPMRETQFSLGAEGKRTLEAAGIDGIRLEKKPPKLWLHFKAINDIRIEAELALNLDYFYACWELPKIGWSHSLIPDSIFAADNRVYAVEVDRGVEGVKYFVETKMAGYLGLEGLNLTAIIILADCKSRMRLLADAVGQLGNGVLYSTLDEVREHGISSRVFYRSIEITGGKPCLRCPIEVSLRQDIVRSISPLESMV